MSAQSLAAAEPLPAAPTISPPEKPRYDPRTRALIEGPIAATLIRLAVPNVLVMFAQAALGLVETYFIGKLGTDSLAGVSLVFPVLMLMQMMSAGAMGGIAHRRQSRARSMPAVAADADALALHALVIRHWSSALPFHAYGPPPGGPDDHSTCHGRRLARRSDAAIIYSSVIFAGAILVWLFNSLANVIRGTGNMAFPALVTVIGVVVLVPLSPCLIFGLRPFPKLASCRRRRRGTRLLYYAVGAIAAGGLSAVRAQRD